ncbi:MAG: ATP synthase F1 subunit epsilon [Rickettsiales bacterium]
MSEQFKLSICTPDGSFFEGNAVEVNLPGSEGRFGVLAEHMNMIANLDPGIVEIKHHDKLSKLVIFDGIAEVHEAGCTVLVEKAQDEAMTKEELAEAIGLAEHNFHKETNHALKESHEKEIKYLKAIAEAF